ncbi:hypothetical protein A9Q78_05655 [Methylophaga sp. 41_12_T18]|nr:hypothetical protein A9Q78_05655 [Methylophaga sp. 41_12_T18]
MAEEETNIEAWVKAHHDIFAEINDYNTKVISFGFVAFFAMAAFVQESAPENAFILAMASMSVAIAIFVFYEVLRIYYINKYASNTAKAIEKLPDDNLLRSVHETKVIWDVRLQKWNAAFFLPSLIFGMIAVALLFYCYWAVLLC